MGIDTVVTVTSKGHKGQQSFFMYEFSSLSVETNPTINVTPHSRSYSICYLLYKKTQ